VFELGDLHRGRFIEVAPKQLGFVPVFRKKDECVPFQACDLLGWEHRRALTQHLAGNAKALRPSLQHFERLLPTHDFVYHNWKSLQAESEQAGLMRRSTYGV
jgi:hypothetical protein